MTSLHIILNDKLEKKEIKDLDTLKNQHLNMDIIERNPPNYFAEYEKNNNLFKQGNNTDNHFVNAFLQAYNNHKTLKIRPDDIKLQLLMIISTFVNNNAEMMRPFFVAHEGKKELEVHFNKLFKTEEIFEEFGKLLEENIKCPEFAQHYKHHFTTTTNLISVVNNLTLMNTLKEYFSFTMICLCGIPSVVLDGTQEDWISLMDTYKYFKSITQEYELKDWYNHFDVIMDMFLEMRMLQKNGHITNPPNHIIKLWERVISYIPQGSGGDTMLGGWIRLFCPYTKDKTIISGMNKKIECLNIKNPIPNEEKYDYYDYQDVAKAFYFGADWDIVPSAIVLTPATMRFEGEPDYKVDIHSGFYAPHYNIDMDMVEMNIGFKIKEAKEVENERMKKYYEDNGVFIKNDTVMIPKVLRKKREDITKYFGNHLTEFYGIDEEQEKLKQYYIDNGVVMESEYRITAPLRFEKENDNILDAFDAKYCHWVKFF
jgi:hypothetical protein